jgi:predicted O-methyltransferase YrrM
MVGEGSMNFFYAEEDKDSENKEQGLLDYVNGLSAERLERVRGNPRKVLEVIDEYCATQNGLDTIGRFKGEIVADYVKQSLPKLTIEVGTYIGYSTIFFANEVFDICNYVSFEQNEQHAHIARELVKLAGLDDRVEIVVGDVQKSVENFAKSDPRAEKGANFVFLRNCDQSMFQALENSNLIHKDQTKIAADKTSALNSQKLLDHINNGPYSSTTIPALDPWGNEDGVCLAKCINK